MQAPSPKAVPQSVADIFEANLLILGPGSLYTSIIPNLLIPEIAEALISRQVPCIYVCNIMTQPGETDGFTVSDHVHKIEEVVGQDIIDLVIVQKNAPLPPHPRCLSPQRRRFCPPRSGTAGVPHSVCRGDAGTKW